MNVIDYLIVEHRVMLELLSCLEAILGEDTDGKGEACKVLTRCFLRVLDKHAQIEDKFLFPELNRILKQDHIKPIRTMEFEHEEIEKISESLKISNDDRFIKVQTSKLILFLRDHFAKEENVLFPLFLEKVGKNRLEAVLKESCLLDRVGCV